MEHLESTLTANTSDHSELPAELMIPAPLSPTDILDQAEENPEYVFEKINNLYAAPLALDVLLPLLSERTIPSHLQHAAYLQLIRHNNLPLLRHYATKMDFAHRTTLSGDNAILIAAADGLIEVLDWLIAQQQLSLDVANHNGVTPLLAALDHQQRSMVRHLVTTYHLSLEIETEQALCPAEAMIANGRIDDLKFLLDEMGLSVETESQQHSNLVAMAVGHNQPEILKLLTAPRAEQGYGLSIENAIFIAVRSGQMDMLALLVNDYQCSPQVLDYNGWSLTDIAIANGQLAMAQLLMQPRTEQGYGIAMRKSAEVLSVLEQNPEPAAATLPWFCLQQFENLLALNQLTSALAWVNQVKACGLCLAEIDAVMAPRYKALITNYLALHIYSFAKPIAEQLKSMLPAPTAEESHLIQTALQGRSAASASRASPHKEGFIPRAPLKRKLGFLPPPERRVRPTTSACDFTSSETNGPRR